MAEQFQTLVHARQGVSEALIFSAFPINADQLADIVGPLEKRFGRKLETKVEIDADLIGGVRVVVGDEVLDTSVKARLERMKSALLA
jgi:F-type H+-transporting ATPase subunit delta